MRVFTITASLDNAAFDEGNDRPEVARILRELADRVEGYGVPQHLRLYDINGNHIGYAQSLEA